MLISILSQQLICYRIIKLCTALAVVDLNRRAIARAIPHQSLRLGQLERGILAIFMFILLKFASKQKKSLIN